MVLVQRVLWWASVVSVAAIELTKETWDDGDPSHQDTVSHQKRTGRNGE